MIEKSRKLLQGLSQSKWKRGNYGQISNPLLWMVFLSVLFIVTTVAFWPEGIKERRMLDETNQSDASGSKVFNDGIVDWKVLPGGDYVAGKPAGAMWLINKPLSELLGHKVRIIGTHQQTGLTIEELPEMAIDEMNAKEYDTSFSSSPGEVTFTRIDSGMAIPLGGKWHFAIRGDDIPNGDVELDVPDGSWELSPSFLSGVYKMTGTKGKLGFINAGFIEGKGNKYMWHFWGTDEELSGDFQVFAVKESTNQLFTVFKGRLHPFKHNGADAAYPSGMMLPAAGKWKLIVIINGRWFGNVVVKVNKAS